MFSNQAKENLATLTAVQQEAIRTLVENQKRRFFIGISPEIMISDFQKINLLKETDPTRATAQETRLINLCLHDPL